MNWDKGPMKTEIKSLQNVRDQLCRAYTIWGEAEHGGDGTSDRIFYEGCASAIEWIGHLTRFTQLEGIMPGVHFHDLNIEILNDCIQQVKDELG